MSIGLRSDTSKKNLVSTHVIKLICMKKIKTIYIYLLLRILSYLIKHISSLISHLAYSFGSLFLSLSLDNGGRTPLRCFRHGTSHAW